MGDGMSDGYRMEMEALARDKRLSAFGQDKCFYCGSGVDGGGFRSEAFDHAVFKHLSGHQHIPDRIWFCSEQCWGFWEKVKSTVASLKAILEGATSPALRISVRKSVEKALREAEIPHV